MSRSLLFLVCSSIIRPVALCFSVRSLRLSTARLLVSYGADSNIPNNRGETPTTIAEYLPIDQQQAFLNTLIRKWRKKFTSSSFRQSSRTIQCRVLWSISFFFFFFFSIGDIFLSSLASDSTALRPRARSYSNVNPPLTTVLANESRTETISSIDRLGVTIIHLSVCLSIDCVALLLLLTDLFHSPSFFSSHLFVSSQTRSSSV